MIPVPRRLAKQAERIGKPDAAFNDDELHKGPFDISSEGMVDAAPVFSVIDIDEDQDIDID